MDSSSLSAVSKVVTAKDSLTALMEFLVDPLLPLKPGTSAPSVEKQQSMAKQMHAVVLLYNYYQRKRHPELQFFDFESFCKLAVTVRPNMMAYMKCMHQSESVSDVLKNELSLTEKTIMDACKLCLALDATQDVSNKKEWPISKVAVLLIDSRKENCALVFGSVTQGVWSVPEKDVEITVVDSGSTEARNKRRRFNNKGLAEEQDANEAVHQNLAFSAVKEATGINRTDLDIQESHVVYSLSKEKTAARFYIMKSSTSINKDLQAPIKDVAESLQGPLVKRFSGGWMTTPVVEYFHLLPYTEILSNSFLREGSSNSLEDLVLGVNNANCNNKEASGATPEASKWKNNNENRVVGPICSVSEPHSSEIDGTIAVLTQKENYIKNACMEENVHQFQKIRTSTENDLIASTNNNPDKTVSTESDLKLTITKCKDEKVDASNKRSTISLKQEKIGGDEELVPFQLNAKLLEKVQSTLAAKEKEISLAALRVLFRKRNMLTHQLRNLGDEIALCDKNIQTILEGGDDDLAIKLDVLINCCNEVSNQRNIPGQDSTCQPVENKIMPQQVGRISEATFTFETSCQELDDISYDNRWTLPTYHVFPSDGGYQANVTLKGMDFEWSCVGDTRSSPCEARDSAAVHMIAKLRGIMCLTK